MGPKSPALFGLKLRVQRENIKVAVNGLVKSVEKVVLGFVHTTTQLRCGADISMTSLPQVSAASPHSKLN